jgi:hypothetical protein
MAKELPYYKHEPSEWLEGEIQVCSDAAIVCFTNLRDGYWLKLGCISYAFALQKYCRRDASILQELIDNGIIDLEGDFIRIRFLDLQLEEFNSVSEKRKNAAEKRWNNANALQVQSKSNAIREDKIREEEIKEDKSKEENNKFDFKKSLLSLGVQKSIVEDWLKIRKKKSAVNSETSLNLITKEINKTNLSANDCISECVMRSWSGFKAEWINKQLNNFNNGTTTQPRRTLDDQVNDLTARVLGINTEQSSGTTSSGNGIEEADCSVLE